LDAIGGEADIPRACSPHEGPYREENPKDADVLVTIDDTMDLDELARAGRRLKGSAQTINLGADIFLADASGRQTRHSDIN
jgi:hypothetical protein